MNIGRAIAVILLMSSALAQQNSTLRESIVKTKLRHLNLEGKIQLSKVDVRNIATEIEGRQLDYEANCSNEGNAEIIRDGLQNLGYFEAKVSDPRCTILRRDSKNILVDLRANVDAGALYRLDQLSFTGQTEFSSEELRDEFKLQRGDLFAADQVRSGLLSVEKMYCAKGYVNSSVVPDTKIDESQHMISVGFDIDEGAKYYFGDLVVEGQASVPGARERLLEAWNNYRGKPYDCGESLERFLRDVGARSEVKADRVFRTLNVDDQAHTVTIAITLADPFQQAAAKQ